MLCPAVTFTCQQSPAYLCLYWNNPVQILCLILNTETIHERNTSYKAAACPPGLSRVHSDRYTNAANGELVFEPKSWSKLGLPHNTPPQLSSCCMGAQPSYKTVQDTDGDTFGDHRYKFTAFFMDYIGLGNSLVQKTNLLFIINKYLREQNFSLFPHPPCGAHAQAGFPCRSMAQQWVVMFSLINWICSRGGVKMNGCFPATVTQSSGNLICILFGRQAAICSKDMLQGQLPNTEQALCHGEN